MWKNTGIGKYKAKKTEIDGIVFDSKKESRMYLDLKTLQNAGKIRDLKTQVPFVIQEGFRRSDGKKIRDIKYIADFTFFDIEQNRPRVIDCKGYRTQVYKIKKKMFDYVMRNQGIYLEENI